MKTVSVSDPGGPILVWKNPETIEKTFIVSVPIGYEAVLVENNNITDILREGAQKEFVYGFFKSSQADYDIYFVKKRINIPLGWGVGDILYDKQTHSEYGAHGSFMVGAQNSEKLVRRFMGYDEKVSVYDVVDCMSSQFVLMVKLELSQWVNSIGLNEAVYCRLDNISVHIMDKLFDVFDQYGLCLDNFIIEHIEISDSDKG